MKSKIFFLFLISTKLIFAQLNLDITPDNYRSSAHITKINVAEAVIEPFFDPTLSGMKEWKFFDGSAHGLKVSPSWAYPSIDWARRPKDGKVISMYRDYSLDVSKYDKLIVCAAFPEGCEITIKAMTEKGETIYKKKLTASIKKEHSLDLEGAKILKRITIELVTPREGPNMGWLVWIGLQNSKLLENYLQQWKDIDTSWDGYIRNDKFIPSFKPKYGLVVDSNEIGKLQEFHAAFLKNNGTTPFIENIKAIKNMIPEQLISEYVPHDENRFNRERDMGKILTVREGYGVQLAVAGILLKDENLMRLAARHALSLAYCPNWKESFWCDFPGSIWNHRAFTQNLYSYQCAMILDLCGEYFTWLGREFIMRRIAEEGLATINWVSWKYEYVHHMNQMALFSHGRLAGSVALEKEWPRAKWMTEQGYKDVYENVENIILPDGGYVEGPTYFQAMAGDASLAMYIYAKARNKTLSEVMPDVMLRTKDFASAIISSDEKKDVIPICDARPMSNFDMLLVMANALPNSDWGNMLNKKLRREGGMPNSFLALKLFEEFKDTLTKSKPVVLLPDMGLTASNRELNGTKVKIAFIGNKAYAEHTHEDKGSFILEFSGETFAMDPGTTDYANPLSITFKYCDRHNMLVPYGFSERAKPLTPIPFDIRPQVSGDEKSYNVYCDLSKSWGSYYKKWIREIKSDDPFSFTIKDVYELSKGEGVEFFWSTELPVEIKNKNVLIKGKKGYVTFTAPDDVDLRVDKLPLADEAVQNRIVLKKKCMAGSIELNVKMALYK